jgi:hypothetical protein
VGNWVEQWTDTSQIPTKIKIHLIKGGKDLPLIIPVRIGRSMLERDLASTANEPPDAEQ